MTTENQQQPAQAPAETPAAVETPGGRPDTSMDNNPTVNKGRIAKAVEAIAARQAAEAGKGAAPEAAAETPQEPAQAPTETPAGERPPLSKTDYWAHLDELQAQLRQAQAQAKRGLPEDVGQLPIQDRLQMVGLDMRDPGMIDTLLDALAETGGGSPAPPAGHFQAPEGADPAMVQLLQQQQATMQQLQQRLEQYEQGTRSVQEQLQHDRRVAAQRAEESKFAAILREAPGRWPVAEKAIANGIVPLGFANDVAESWIKQTGQAPTYAQVLQGVDSYLRKEAEKTASLLGEIERPAPAVAATPASAPADGAGTLAPVEAGASDRPLTREERVARAAALIKERQRTRKQV